MTQKSTDNLEFLKQTQTSVQERKEHDVHVQNRKLQLQGIMMYGKVPFGYQINPFTKKYEKLKGYDEIIFEMFYQYARGCEMTTVARIINELYGVKDSTVTSGSQKNLRTRKMVSIFTNPLYMGYPSYNRTETVAGKLSINPKEKWIMSEKRYEEFAYVEEELWNRAYERLLNDVNYKKLM